MLLPTVPHFRFRLRVYWEDTDAGGVVFYANYLKFFERARTEWLRGLGFSQQALKREDGAIFVVSQTTVRYHRPARLDDELCVTVQLREAGRASMLIAQQAWRGDELMADGEIRIGCVDSHTFKLRRIPAPITLVLELELAPALSQGNAGPPQVSLTPSGGGRRMSSAWGRS